MTDKPNNQGKSRGYVTFGIPASWTRKPAQKAVRGQRARQRLGAILNADQLAIIVTNRRLRRGIPQDSIKR